MQEKKVELFENIRREFYLNNKTVRRIAREVGVHRRTVRQAIESATPPERIFSLRPAPVLTPEVKAIINSWLESDKHAPRKQRHTGGRIHQRLSAELGFGGAKSTVRRYVGVARRELGLSTERYVPQIHHPGEEAEVDWYEAHVVFEWGEEVVQFFQMRACFSRKEFHMAFPRQTQQAFFEGHVNAFKYFNGVFKVIRYDNLKSAVTRVLKGRNRVESERFIALRSHYLFASEFCRPGKVGAHEKGGVEGSVGRFRRAHLVPVPKVKDYERLNEHLLSCCLTDDQRRVTGSETTIGEDWEKEQPHLLFLPKTEFGTAEVSEVRVNLHGLIVVRTNRYSVPIKLVGMQVETRVYARHVEAWHKGTKVVLHQRLQGRHGIRVCLDHYLELLRIKPGALRRSLALHQTRTSGHWSELYDSLWVKLIERLGERKGTLELIEVLFLNRDFSSEEVVTAVSKALELGCLESVHIRVLLRQQRQSHEYQPLQGLGGLERFNRPMSDIRVYDSLLTNAQGGI